MLVPAKLLLSGVFPFMLLMGVAVAEGLNAPSYQAQGSDVSGRNFDGTNLSLANFSGSNATGSSFRNVQMDYANLSLANFSRADLTNTTFKLALIEFTDFSEVKGLTAAQLSEACLTRPDKEEKLGVDGFDAASYRMPEGCQLWEHIARG